MNDGIGYSGNESDLRFFQTILWELTNDLDKLLAMRADTPLADNPDGFSLQNYVDANKRLLLIQQQFGNADIAHGMARRIIAVEELPVFHGADFAASNHEALAIAYASLGETDKARQWTDRLLNDRDETYNAYGLPGFLALAALDIDRAVELILDFKARHPTWPGTDFVAIAHFANRGLILRPRMQDFYRQEGKWIDYLAERVPQYGELQ